MDLTDKGLEGRMSLAQLAGGPALFDRGFRGKSNPLELLVLKMAYVDRQTKLASAAPAAVVLAYAMPVHGRGAAALAGPLGHGRAGDDLSASKQRPPAVLGSAAEPAYSTRIVVAHSSISGPVSDLSQEVPALGDVEWPARVAPLGPPRPHCQWAHHSETKSMGSVGWDQWDHRNKE
jgi:hypothetical protein